jgi:tRNA-specific 2-thiouridylase
VNLDGCADQDAEDARRVAEHIGIPFYSWDFEERYRAKVVDPLVAGYRAGRTPNPDAACNVEIKFGAFLEAARELGADAVATGHYARIVERDGMPYLAEGVDGNKDQSYFLALLGEEQLAHAIFPIGELTKPEVRSIAAAAGLPTATKKDSQGICFLGKVSLTDYLQTQIEKRVGNVLNTKGKVIGEHPGAWFLTVGQRSGFMITAKRGGEATPPYYISARDIEANTITVAEAGDPQLRIQGVRLEEVATHTAMQAAGEGGLKVWVRTRYRQEKAPAVLTMGEGVWEIRFEQAHPVAALGQVAACYDEEGVLLLGGMIAQIL